MLFSDNSGVCFHIEGFGRRMNGGGYHNSNVHIFVGGDEPRCLLSERFDIDNRNYSRLSLCECAVQQLLEFRTNIKVLDFCSALLVFRYVPMI